MFRMMRAVPRMASRRVASQKSQTVMARRPRQEQESPCKLASRAMSSQAKVQEQEFDQRYVEYFNR